MPRKVPLRLTHFGSRIRISGDGVKKAYNGYIDYDHQWQWNAAWIGNSYRWREVLNRGRGKPIENRSGKKEKKFWRKVHRRIERLAS